MDLEGEMVDAAPTAAERRMIMATGFNTQVSNGEYRLQFETDNKEHYLLMQSTARRCVDGVHMTNAQKIRAMSDEDMAKWIDWLFGRCEWCDTDKIATDDCNDVECAPCILKWLKQPFKGR